MYRFTEIWIEEIKVSPFHVVRGRISKVQANASSLIGNPEQPRLDLDKSYSFSGFDLLLL